MPIIKILVYKKINSLKNKIFHLACLSIFLTAYSTSSFASKSLGSIFSATQIYHLSALLNPLSVKPVLNECDLTISIGDAEEQYRLGLRYFNDFNRDEFDIKALMLFQAAADQGHAEALRMLSQCYEQGIGTAIDIQKAEELFQLAELQTAVDQNDAQAQYKLGCYYETGAGGVKQNQVKARGLIKLAADSELAEAQCALARYFQNGIGGPKNLEEAEELLQMAAEQEQESVKIQKTYKLLQEIENTKTEEILEQFEKTDDDVQNYITKLKELEKIFAIKNSYKIKTEVRRAFEKLKIEDRSFYFNNYNFGQVIARLIKIQRCKVCLRNKCIPGYFWVKQNKQVNDKFIYRHTEQKPIYDSSDESSEDPLRIKLQVADTRTFNFVYTGTSSDRQPLNGLIRRSNHGIKGNQIQYTDKFSGAYPDSKDDKQKLANFLQDHETKIILLIFEVARRKHEQDCYCDLPILCAISMALHLIEQRHLPKEEFWAKDGEYHMFSGMREKRELAIKKIIKLFLHKNCEAGAGSDAFKNIISDFVNCPINKLMHK